MNKHDHSHETGPGYHKQEKHTKQGPHSTAKSKRAVHKDWRVWVVVGLMLAGMAVYVFSLDESFWPSGDSKDEVPAEAPAE